MVKMPSAPVAAPDERSNSPPIISSATATAMMPSGAAAWSRIDWAPLAWPNLTETAQKKTHTATAPMAAPISGRTSARWKTPRYASRSSAFGAALAPAVVSLIGDGSPPMECVRFVAPRGRPIGRFRDGYWTRPGIDPDQKATGSAVAEPVIADVDQRVPAAESSLTAAALSGVTKPGPVSTGRPPPAWLALVASRYMRTTGR